MADSKDRILPEVYDTGNVQLDDHLARSQRAALLPVQAASIRGKNGSVQIDPQVSVWAPWGPNSFRVASALARVRTTDAQVTQLLEAEIPDGCLTKYIACVSGYSSAGQATSVDLTISYKRSGSTVTAVGTVAEANRQEDDSAWDATLTVSTIYFRVNVTGKASTDILWGCELRAQITPWELI